MKFIFAASILALSVIVTKKKKWTPFECTLILAYHQRHHVLYISLGVFGLTHQGHQDHHTSEQVVAVRARFAWTSACLVVSLLLSSTKDGG